MAIALETPDLSNVRVTTGETPSFSDLASASVQADRLSSFAYGAKSARYDAYKARIADIYAATGEQLDNPLGAMPSKADYDALQEEVRRSPVAVSHTDFFERRFADRVQELGRRYPDKLAQIRPDVPIDEDAARLTREAVQTQSEMEERAGGLAGKLAPLAGGLYSGFRYDPTMIPMMLFGGGAGGGAARGLLRRAMLDAAIMGTSRAVQQPWVQEWRAAAGLPAGWKEGAEDVAMGALSGFAFGGVMHGAPRLARYGVGKPRGEDVAFGDNVIRGVPFGKAQEAAGAQLGRELGDLKPEQPAKPVEAPGREAPPEQPAAPEPLDTLAKPHNRDMHEQWADKLADSIEHLPDEHPVKRAFQGDDAELLRLNRELGTLDDDPARRGAAGHLEDLHGTDEAPFGLDDATHLRNLAEAIRQVAGPTDVITSQAHLDQLRRGHADIHPAPPEMSPSEIEDVVSMWHWVKEMQRTRKPAGLADYLRSLGGIADESGEVSRILGKKRNSGGLINGKGMSLDDAALHAFERGYFDRADRPTVAEFLDALDDDLRGNRRVAAADRELMDNMRAADDMARSLFDLGVHDARTETEVRERLAAGEANARAGGEGPRRGEAGAGAEDGPPGWSEAELKSVRTSAAERMRLVRRIESGDYLEHEFDQLRGIVEREIADVVKRLPSGIKTDVLYTPEGIEGGYTPNQRALFVSLLSYDPKAIATHEEVHVLRNLGVDAEGRKISLFTDAEWRLLTEKADALGIADKPLLEGRRSIRDVYPETYGDRFMRNGVLDRAALDDIIAEEAVAYMRQKRVQGEDFGHAVNSVFGKLQRFLDRVRNALRGLGFQTAEDVMRAIDRGDVARRAELQRFAAEQDVKAGVVRPDGTLFAFAGEKAKTADHAKLAEARKMEADGKDREAIWKATGWFRGVDKKWRFEIDDSTARPAWKRNDLFTMERRFGEALHNPELFAAYPHLGDTPAEIGIGFSDGYYDPPETRGGARFFATAPTDERIASIAAHESQHGIQNAEGFARGGSAEGVRAALGGRIPERYLTPEILDEAYRRLAGEVEARAVQTRMSLTPEQRAARPPWLDYDVPEDQQIVRGVRAEMQRFAAAEDVKAGVVRPDGTLFAFAGEKAKTADHAKLAEARKMEVDGKDREAIWKATGWFRGVDKKWRFEIDDSTATAKFGSGIGFGKKSPLQHAGIAEAYPDVKPSIMASNTGVESGYYHQKIESDRWWIRMLKGPLAPESIVVSGPNTFRIRDVGMHEAQHAIQNHEGFASGASTADVTMTDAMRAERLIENMQGEEGEDLREIIRRAAAKGKKYDAIRELAYRMSAGETEARAVQKRLDMTPEQRAARPPWLDYDVPEEQQIVRGVRGVRGGAAEPGTLYALSEDADKAKRLAEPLGLAKPQQRARPDGLDEILGGERLPVDQEKQIDPAKAAFARLPEAEQKEVLARYREELMAAARQRGEQPSSTGNIFDDLVKPTTAQRIAFDRIAKQLEAEAAQRERVAQMANEKLNQVIRPALISGRDARGQVDPGRNLQNLIEYFGEQDAGHIGPSVKGRMHVILGQARQMMEGPIEHFNRVSVLKGVRQNKADLENVVREAFGEDTGSPEAKAMAKAWGDAAEWLRTRFNEAGGVIGKLDKWGLPQSHDATKVLGATAQEWRAFIKPLLADKQIDHMTGLELTPQQLEARLVYINETIRTQGWAHKDPSFQPVGRGSLWSQHADTRYLIFKDADSWMKYQQRFGDGDAFATMMGHIRVMSRDIAAMEVLGPNPAAMLRFAGQLVEKLAAMKGAGYDAAFPAQTEILGRKIKDPVERARAQVLLADQMWDHFMGRTGVPVNALGRNLATARNVLTAARLGSAVLSEISELGFMPLARKFAGVPMFKGMISDTIAQLREAPRHEAIRAGLEVETMLHVLGETARYAREEAANAWSQRVASAVLEKSGLTPYTEAKKRGAGLRFLMTFADHVDKPMAKLPDDLARLLTRYGISAGEWDQIRSSPLHDMINAEPVHGVALPPGQRGYVAFANASERNARGAKIFAGSDFAALPRWMREAMNQHGVMPEEWEATRAILQGGGEALQKELFNFHRNLFATNDRDSMAWAKRMVGERRQAPQDAAYILRPNEIAASVGRDLADRFHEMVLMESEYFVPNRTLRVGARVLGGTRPGEVAGESVRSLMQFKGFTFTIMQHQLMRVAREMTGGSKASGAAYLAGMLATTTVLGAAVLQIRNILARKDPEPMDDWRFWGQAMLQGGGTALYGDFLKMETDRFGNSLGEALAGPVFSTAFKAGRIATGAVRARRGPPIQRRRADGDAAARYHAWIEHLVFAHGHRRHHHRSPARAGGP